MKGTEGDGNRPVAGKLDLFPLQAKEVFCVFVCGAATYENKASFVDRLGAQVLALISFSC